MKKNLRQMGNSWGIIIPKAILDLMQINPVKDEIEFEYVDNEIRIRKAK